MWWHQMGAGHRGMVTTPKCHPNCIGDPYGIWRHQKGTPRDGDNPKVSPKLHWGPLWDLVAPNEGRTQRDGDNSKVSPNIMTGDPYGIWQHQKGTPRNGDNPKVSPNAMTGDPCGIWWHQKGTPRDGDNPKVSPIIALGTLVGVDGTRWGQDTEGW